MIFKTLTAPFVRGLTPRGWLNYLIMGGLVLGKLASDRSDKNRDREEWYRHQEDVRRRRSEAASQFNDRIAGLEGIDLGKVGEASFTPQAPPVGGGTSLDPFAAIGSFGAMLDQGNQQGVGLTAEGQPEDYFGNAAQNAGTEAAAAQAGGGIGTTAPPMQRRAGGNPWDTGYAR